MVGMKKAATDAICGGFTPPLLKTTRGAAVQSTETDQKTRPDLDAQWATAVAAARAQIKSYEAVTPGPCPPESLWDETSDMPEEVARAVSDVWLAGLASERDRADRAETALDQAPHDSMCAVDYMVACDCWKSEATA